MNRFLILLSICFLGACNETPSQDSVMIDALKTEIIHLESNLLAMELECMGKDTGPGTLMHIVSFTFKESLHNQAKEEILNSFNSLAKIKGLKSIKVGDLLDLDNHNQNLNSGLILQMAFDSTEDLLAYQQSKLQIQQRATLKNYLKSPPLIQSYILDLHQLE